MTLAEYPTLDAFLQKCLAATIAVPIDQEGTIHAASLLYWNKSEPLELYFVTSRSSEKFQLLEHEAEIRCAAVVGTEKHTPFSLQMRGTIKEVDPTSYSSELEAYYEKRGNHDDDISSPDSCLLKFTPDWARFTDYSKGYDKKFLELE